MNDPNEVAWHVRSTFFFFDGRSFVFRRFRFKEKFEDTKRVNQVFRQKGFRSSYSTSDTCRVNEPIDIHVAVAKLDHRNLLPATKFSPLNLFYCQCITHSKKKQTKNITISTYITFIVIYISWKIKKIQKQLKKK